MTKKLNSKYISFHAYEPFYFVIRNFFNDNLNGNADQISVNNKTFNGQNKKTLYRNGCFNGITIYLVILDEMLGTLEATIINIICYRIESSNHSVLYTTMLTIFWSAAVCGILWKQRQIYYCVQHYDYSI